MIANSLSSPGEVLPEFPKATHCKAADLHRFPSMSRFTSVNDAIAEIPEGLPLHNPEQMATRNDVPYDGNLPLRNTICCGGGPISHPSGKRAFTHRELACLQGFPLEHQFGPARARKQIGNAYPPIVAKVFFEAVIQAGANCSLTCSLPRHKPNLQATDMSLGVTPLHALHESDKTRFHYSKEISGASGAVFLYGETLIYPLRKAFETI